MSINFKVRSVTLFYYGDHKCCVSLQKYAVSDNLYKSYTLHKILWDTNRQTKVKKGSKFETEPIKKDKKLIT